MEHENEKILEDLSAIWSEILGLDVVDPRATFVSLGGTSIAAEQIASRVREALHVEFNGVEILRFQTLERIGGIVATRSQVLNGEGAQAAEERG